MISLSSRLLMALGNFFSPFTHTPLIVVVLEVDVPFFTLFKHRFSAASREHNIRLLTPTSPPLGYCKRSYLSRGKMTISRRVVGMHKSTGAVAQKYGYGLERYIKQTYTFARKDRSMPAFYRCYYRSYTPGRCQLVGSGLTCSYP